MEGRIDDIAKAQDMAKAEKKLRDLGRSQAEIAEGHDKKTDAVPAIDLERFKVNAEAIIQEGQRLARALKNREDDRFDPLIEPENLRRFTGLLNGLNEFVSSSKAEEVQNVLFGIRKVLDTIGHATQPRVFREDADSLQKVSSALKSFGEVIRDSKSPNLGEDINKALNGINSVVESNWVYIAKKRDLLRRY